MNASDRRQRVPPAEKAKIAADLSNDQGDFFALARLQRSAGMSISLAPLPAPRGDVDFACTSTGAPRRCRFRSHLYRRSAGDVDFACTSTGAPRAPAVACRRALSHLSARAPCICARAQGAMDEARRRFTPSRFIADGAPAMEIWTARAVPGGSAASGAHFRALVRAQRMGSFICWSWASVAASMTESAFDGSMTGRSMS